MNLLKDWIGNKKTVFTTLGASAHATEERQSQDFYATDPIALKLLLREEKFSNVWECACGQGHLSEVLKQTGIHGKSTDYINRGYGDGQVDFLGIENQKWGGDIITNPPFRYAQEFIEKALTIIDAERKVAMFLRIQFLEGKERGRFFKKHPPKFIYVSSRRIKCAKNGDFVKYSANSAICYCWFVWEKGFKGETVLKWFN